jgi:methyl-accepting chemotaxis protein
MNNYPWTEKAHRAFFWILGLQSLFSLYAGFAQDQILIALAVTFIVVVPTLSVVATSPHSSVAKHMMGLSTQMLTALHIHMYYGMTELHFEIFVVLAALSWYKDWRLFISSVGFVAVHHLGFYLMQAQGIGVWIFPADHLHFSMVLFHGFFAVAEGILLAIMAAQAHVESCRGLALRNTIHEMLPDDGSINIRRGMELVEKDSDFGKLVVAVHDTLVALGENAERVDQGVETAIEVNGNLTRTADDGVTQAITIASAMEQMNATINDVAARTSEISVSANEVLSNTQEAQGFLTESNDEVSQLRSKLQNMEQIVSDLNNKTKEIGGVMESIQAVAEQTNLLALNAAIEAARAGEAGRGFAVVADEVRALAGNTKDSTDRIQEVSQSLFSDTEKAVALIKECVNSAEQSSRSSESASSGMNSLLGHMDQVNSSLTSVATAAEQQVAAANEIARVAEAMGEIAAENKSEIGRSNDSINNVKQSVAQANTQVAKFTI